MDFAKVGKQIGQGAYATVAFGLHKESSKKVAIKIYDAWPQVCHSHCDIYNLMLQYVAVLIRGQWVHVAQVLDFVGEQPKLTLCFFSLRRSTNS